MAGPYKMKNSALHMGAKHGTPIQANYASPVKNLKGGQHKIDMNKNGRIDKGDFDMMNNSPANMGSSPMKTNVPTKEESDKGVTAAGISKHSYESTTNPDGSKETTSSRIAQSKPNNLVEKNPKSNYEKHEITSKGHHRLPDEKRTTITDKGKTTKKIEKI